MGKASFGTNTAGRPPQRKWHSIPRIAHATPQQRYSFTLALAVVLACVPGICGAPLSEDWNREPRTMDRLSTEASEKIQSAAPLQLVSKDELVRSLAGTSRVESLAEKLAKGEQGSYLDRLHTEVSKLLADAPVLQLQWRTGRFKTLAFDPKSGDYFECVASHSDTQLRSRVRTHDPSRTGVHSRALTHLAGLNYSDLAACNISTTGEYEATSWLGGPFIKFGERVATTEFVLAAVVADSLSYYRRQYRIDFPDRTTTYNKPIGMVGLQVYLINKGTGEIAWRSGTGGVSGQDDTLFLDGAADTATWSRDISSIAWYPSCSLFEYQTSTCPLAARPDFYQETRFVYVADSGNCRVRMVDFDSGRVITRWGSACLGPDAAQSDYKDSPVDSEVVLGAKIAVAWASWYFLIVVDRDAHRVRKFVTSQHQGLSPLAGSTSENACNGTLRDGPGLQATFCRPDAVAVTTDGTRAVVSEDIPGGPRRLRVLDCTPTFLGGGDVADVTCGVRTLVHSPVSGPHNLFTSFGGLALTSDGLYLVAGSWDETEYPYDWFPGLEGARYDVVVVVSIQSGAVRAVSHQGALLEGRTVAGAEVAGGRLVLTLGEHYRVQTNDFENIDYFIPKTSIIKVRIDPAELSSPSCNASTDTNDNGDRGLVAISANLRTQTHESGPGQAEEAAVDVGQQLGAESEKEVGGGWRLWGHAGRVAEDAPEMVGVESEDGVVRVVKTAAMVKLLEHHAA